MARLPRLVIPEHLHHLIQRGIAGTDLFRDQADYEFFYQCLKNAAKQFQIAIHAYVLLPDHLHLLVTPADETGLGKFMQWLGRNYVPYYNRKYMRAGTLWQGRFRATVLEAASYFIPCCIFIESHPQRTGILSDASEYHWSSLAHHCGYKTDPLLTDHTAYWRLGNTPFQREAAYKEILHHGLGRQQIQQLSQATQKAWALGSAEFIQTLEKLTERRLAPVRRGRPAKKSGISNEG